MNWNWKDYRKKKHQFKSYYCVGCKQQKPCKLLTGWSAEYKNYCCSCYYRNWQARNQDYLDYQTFYQQEVKQQQDRYKQYQLLKSYQGCSQCGSKAVDAYLLDEEKKLTCSYCLEEKNRALEIERRKKKGENLYPLAFAGSNPVSFSEKQKWYKKHWGINLNEWLERKGVHSEPSQNFSQLPVNADCTREWLKDKEHLKHCQCLEKKAQELVEFYTSSLKEYQEKLRECSCKPSEKVRVDSDDFAWCERCEANIVAASKKRVIKNRNDPKFWGLEVVEKVLCGDCLANYQGQMPVSKKYTFWKYLKRGYYVG